jgi:hypothetical protein
LLTLLSLNEAGNFIDAIKITGDKLVVFYSYLEVTFQKETISRMPTESTIFISNSETSSAGGSQN